MFLPCGGCSPLLACLEPEDLVSLVSAGTELLGMVAPLGRLLSPVLEVDLRRWPQALRRIECSQVEELVLAWADDEDPQEVAAGLYVMDWLSSAAALEKRSLSLRRLHLGAQRLSQRFPEAVAGFLTSMQQAPVQELCPGLLQPSMLPLLSGFAGLRSLRLSMELEDPGAFADSWEALARCPSLRALSLWASGSSPALEGETLERCIFAVRSTELKSLELNVSLLQCGLGKLRWPKSLRKLCVLGEGFCKGAADHCCGEFAAHVREAGIDDLHLDCWWGLSNRGWRKLLTALSGAQLHRLQLSWQRGPRGKTFARIARFIEATPCLRQLVLEIPTGEEWPTGRGLWHLEEVATQRAVAVSWYGGGPLIQDLEVKIVIH